MSLVFKSRIESMPIGNAIDAVLKGVGQTRVSAAGNNCCVVVFADAMGRTALYNVNLVNPGPQGDDELHVDPQISVSFDILARALGRKIDQSIIAKAYDEGVATGNPVAAINDAIRGWITGFAGTSVLVNTKASPNGSATTVTNFGKNKPLSAKIFDLNGDLTSTDAEMVDAILG